MKPIHARKALLSGLLLACMATPVVAGPIVTQWNYSTNATFTDATFTFGSGTTNGGTPLPGTDYELSWGATGGSFQGSNANRSAFTIGNGVDGTLTGGGPAQGSVDTLIGGGVPNASQIGVGMNVTHWNNIIGATFATLASGTVFDTLSLTPVLPAPGPVVNAPDITFNFNFKETLNGGPCAAGTPTPCGDIFGIFGIPTLNQMFSYDGNNYLASVLILDDQGGVSPIGTLEAEQCSAIGFAQGCQGFLTEEDAATTVQFAFAVSTAPVFDVPEPATLALFSLGLFGLGFRRWKRQ